MIARLRMSLSLVLALGVMLSAGMQTAQADRFTYVDRDGKTIEVEARLAGSGQGMHALETADGQFRLVPQGAVKKRVPSAPPEPLDANAMVAQLTAQFGEERFRSYKQKPYVIGLVLASPLPKSAETRVRGVLRKAARFMRTVEGVFLKFAKEVRLPIEPPRFPLVLLIFESDKDFEAYTKVATGGQGLSAGVIAGFYSALTNYLAIRLSECNTYETPLHEAIHLQVHNRGVFQRLAPIPVWFNEGIATGFEGNSERINIGPQKITARYARMAMAARNINWNNVVSDDRAFGGDVLAGEAYAHAWSLHWMMVTKYKTKYAKYVRVLQQKQPLQKKDADDRVREFEETFGTTVAAMQKDFRQALEVGIRKQKIALIPRKKPGLSVTQAGQAEIELSAVRRLDLGGQMEVFGRMRNISPIRPMTFHVTVETNGGMYAEWIIPNLGVKKTFQLKKQYVRKVMRNSPGSLGNGFQVRARAVSPESDEARNWKKGQPPVPVYRRR